jgi:hypothetical protein
MRSYRTTEFRADVTSQFGFGSMPIAHRVMSPLCRFSVIVSTTPVAKCHFLTVLRNTDGLE